MNCTKMKKLFRKGTLSILLLGVITFFTYPLSAQTNSRSGKGLYEIFSTKIPDGAQWKAQDNKFVRDGGYSKKSENYITKLEERLEENEASIKNRKKSFQIDSLELNSSVVEPTVSLDAKEKERE